MNQQLPRAPTVLSTQPPSEVPPQPVPHDTPFHSGTKSCDNVQHALTQSTRHTTLPTCTKHTLNITHKDNQGCLFPSLFTKQAVSSSPKRAAASSQPWEHQRSTLLVTKRWATQHGKASLHPPTHRSCCAARTHNPAWPPLYPFHHHPPARTLAGGGSGRPTTRGGAVYSLLWLARSILGTSGSAAWPAAATRSLRKRGSMRYLGGHSKSVWL